MWLAVVYFVFVERWITVCPGLPPKISLCNFLSDQMLHSPIALGHQSHGVAKGRHRNCRVHSGSWSIPKHNAGESRRFLIFWSHQPAPCPLPLPIYPSHICTFVCVVASVHSSPSCFSICLLRRLAISSTNILLSTELSQFVIVYVCTLCMSILLSWFLLHFSQVVPK
jgi:hypothetical protein